jgi:type III secretion protein R
MPAAPDLFLLLVIIVALTVLPMLALVATSYLKIVVVLGLVRNAMGVQQVPPNLVLSSIAIALTAFVMAPTIDQIGKSLENDKSFYDERVSPRVIIRLGEHVRQPWAAFLLRHTPPEDRAFFSAAAKDLWGGDGAQAPDPESLLVLVPAFTVRELTRAFQIGFILYMAFIAVDLIVANVIQAFGLTMVSPTPVAIPFKLLLFVAFDGWQKLIYALVLSYR